MRYCPNCGSTTADSDKFCSNCGQPVTDLGANQIQQPEVQPKKRHIVRNIFLGIFAAIGILVVALIVFGVYAVLSEPEIDVPSVYKDGCNYYNKAMYSEASDCFALIDEADGEYKDTELYIILCNAHLHHHLDNEQVKTLKRNIDFNDTKSVLLSDSSIAQQFLLGYWQTENKQKSLEIYAESDSIWVHTNLDNSNWDKAEGYYIIDGVFGLYMPKAENESKDDIENSDLLEDTDEFDRNDLFRITIIDADKISAVILKDDSRYVLEREH